MSTSQIYVIDDLPPETVAMLQSLYSRSPRSVVEHIEKARKNAASFMAQFYVGYGHKSIGDCGTTTIFIEGVSMLAAKAIQDWPLYSGQEASTRYLDFSKMPVIDPIGTPKSKAWIERLMALYTETLPLVVQSVMAQRPLEPGEDEVVYGKACNARAFDICRSLLPAGATTYVSWHTNLRQAADHLKQMAEHPLDEVRGLADDILTALKEKYPSSFGHEVKPVARDYFRSCQSRVAYDHLMPTRSGRFEFTNKLDEDEVDRFWELIAYRPKFTELPHQLRACGNVSFTFPLDFGSYRDIQRQRSMFMIQPLHTPDHGFHPWYVENLHEIYLSNEQPVLMELDALMGELAEFNITAEYRQYFVPMGYVSWLKAVAPLPAAVYVAELRSMTTVHPTLRPIAQDLGKALQQALPGISLWIDYSPDAFSFKRGKQDIVKK